MLFRSLLLNLVTVPLYTGSPIFLGATTRREFGARTAFPNAKRVILKLPEEPARSLEGGNAEHLHDSPVNDDTANPVDTRTQEPDNCHDDIDSSTELLPSEEPLSLPDLITMSEPELDICEDTRNQYYQDKFFSDIVKQPMNYKNFEVDSGLVYLRDNGRQVLCIPDITLGNRRLREVIISHAHSILAHLGPSKTTNYLRDNVWWKGINSDVEAFCKSCAICQTSKPRNHPNYGLLETLNVPSYPWETIGIDFVGPLPESKTLNGTFDMILVIIDYLTVMVHLIPTKQTYRAKDIAEVMFDRVYKLHGMPRNIISDRDSLFTSTFWTKLNELTRSELRMSSSFHPQTDGITERANRTITQMLRSCISPNQKDWATKLPAIEFAMNSARSETTGFTPFMLNYGRSPRSMIWESNSEFPGVRVFAQRMKDAILRAHDSIIAARVKQTVMANRKRKDVPFAKGDLVYLSTANLTLPKGHARKLAPKFIGPYKIIDDYRNNTFMLDLPAELKQRGIHPAFHASLLRIHIPNDDRRFPGRQLQQLVGLGKVEELSVKRITDHHGKGIDSLFLVEYSNRDTVWLPHHEVSHLEAFSQYLEALNITTANDLPHRSSPSQDLPLFSMSADEGTTCRQAFDLIDQVLLNLGNSATQTEATNCHNPSGSSPSPRTTRSKKMYKRRARRPPTNLPRSPMNFTPLDLERFRATAAAIRDGSFDIKRDIVPPGYVNFCVLHAEDPDPYQRFPLPPAFGLARTERAKKNKRGKGESRYLTRVIFDRFAADTMTRKHPKFRTTHRAHTVQERANSGQSRENTRRHEPYPNNRRNGGRGAGHKEHNNRGGRRTFYKNKSRDFCTGTQGHAATDEPFSQNLMSPDVLNGIDDIFKTLDITSTAGDSQIPSPMEPSAGPSTIASSSTDTSTTV